MNYRVLPSSNGQHMWHLENEQGVWLYSEPLYNRQDCLRSIQSSKANLDSSHLAAFQASDYNFYIHQVARNGKILARSGGYWKKLEDAQAAVKLIQSTAYAAAVVE